MDKRKQLQLEYKGNRCCKCNLTVTEVLARFGTISQVFHFNHVDASKKHEQYENVIRRTMSTEVLDELDKCVLLCSFCHGVLHGQNVTGEMTVKTELDGIEYQQTIKMQGILEIDPTTQEPSFFFFLDGPLKVELFQVKVGEEPPAIHSLEQLQGDLGLQLILGTKWSGRFEVRSLQNKWMMTATKLDERNFRLEMNVVCPFLKAELVFDEGKRPDIWLRNGVAIHKESPIQRNGRYTLKCIYPDVISDEDETARQ